MLFVAFFLSLPNFSLLFFQTYCTLSIALTNSPLLWLLFHFYFLWMFPLSLSCLVFFAIFHPSRSFSLSHTNSLFFTPQGVSISSDLMSDDMIVQGGPRFSPMHSPVRYRRYSPISPLRYISYHLSGTFSAIMSYIRSGNEVSTQNKCCWPSDLRHHHLFHHLQIGCSPRRKLQPRGVVPGLNNHQGHHLHHPFQHNDYSPFIALEDLHPD